MTCKEYRAAGFKYSLAEHYGDGFYNGTRAVRNDPRLQRWYSVMALCSARSGYADWPPYRAYKLGFARGARTAI